MFCRLADPVVPLPGLFIATFTSCLFNIILFSFFLSPLLLVVPSRRVVNIPFPFTQTCMEFQFRFKVMSKSVPFSFIYWAWLLHCWASTHLLCAFYEAWASLLTIHHCVNAEQKNIRGVNSKFPRCVCLQWRMYNRPPTSLRFYRVYIYKQFFISTGTQFKILSCVSNSSLHNILPSNLT